MMFKTLLGLTTVILAGSLLGDHTNGLDAEGGKGLRYLDDLRPMDTTAEVPELAKEDDDGVDGGDSDDDDGEQAGGSTRSADCCPGTDYWPACRSIGYPGCMPGVVRWPQCQNDKTRD
ncbi:hypothetical protein PHYPSEUDO_011796 [Phytophthora pseudosyringae]|uniref:Uncharacterized protein n=1 Tax=Phytophthora pseudosyringae TaxID=221518 RepID=A0A8T1W5E4_9STRA|nr:hypothetical protein PHYPSEUDO_011796 [Phytophthora pseudosyringae]